MGSGTGEIDVQPRALRVREATRAYRIGKTRLYALMKEGRLPSVKVGGTRLIPIEGLEALIATEQANALTPSPTNA